MKIQEMFVKPIDRDIKGVIKVGQGEDSNVKQELEEYVVTRELQKHFAEFFSAYKKGITGNTDKMGVWISGFFGSGKSHFLKILSYLLEDKVVDGKHAIDYFIDDEKITDGMVLGDMKLAAETPADVILFNIDSKGAASGKQDKNTAFSVTLFGLVAAVFLGGVFFIVFLCFPIVVLESLHYTVEIIVGEFTASKKAAHLFHKFHCLLFTTVAVPFCGGGDEIIILVMKIVCGDAQNCCQTGIHATILRIGLSFFIVADCVHAKPGLLCKFLLRHLLLKPECSELFTKCHFHILQSYTNRL